MRALSIRQPYAELILRGEKTIEYRSRPTRLIGERFLIYAATPKTAAEREEVRRLAGDSHDERVSGCMGERVKSNGHPITPSPHHPLSTGFPSGVIVGSAVISHCTNGTPNLYEWHLKDVKRFKTPRKPKGRPQPVWFRPF